MIHSAVLYSTNTKLSYLCHLSVYTSAAFCEKSIYSGKNAERVRLEKFFTNRTDILSPVFKLDDQFDCQACCEVLHCAAFSNSLQSQEQWAHLVRLSTMNAETLLHRSIPDGTRADTFLPRTTRKADEFCSRLFSWCDYWTPLESNCAEFAWD